MTDVPHFALPFRYASDGQVATSEQDSQQEIAEACELILRYPVGYRSELMDFGCPELVFYTEPVDTSAMVTALATWEPRAQALIEEDPSLIPALVSRITASLAEGGTP
jgi:phage baseplate assembly protein W